MWLGTLISNMEIHIDVMYTNIVSITLTLFLPVGRTGLVVRASDSRSGDPGSILGRVGVLFP